MFDTLYLLLLVTEGQNFGNLEREREGERETERERENL
jgi:hypothetical protein